MKNNTNTTQTMNTIGSTTFTFLVLIGVLLLSSVKMFAQEKAVAQITVSVSTSIANDDNTTSSQAAVSETNSNMNMVSWFMGTKQTPKADSSVESASSSKKQMINSGIAPNRLLMKAFLKKAAAFQSAVA